MASIKDVLIVEDHPQAASVLTSAVRREFCEVQVLTAANVREGKVQLFHNSFDMALIDLGLPDGSGLELIRQIVASTPSTLVIVTTIFEDEFNLFEALRAGANGYLLKGHSELELASYLRDAVAGQLPLSPSIAQSVLAYFRNHRDTIKIAEESEKNEDSVRYPMGEELTERELEILALIAKGYRVKEVSQLLQIAANTVSVHIKSIYRKLNLHNRAEATAVAVSLNLYTP